MIALNRKNLGMTVGLLYNVLIAKKWAMDLAIVQIQKKKDLASIAIKKVTCQEIALSQEYSNVIIVIRKDIKHENAQNLENQEMKILEVDSEQEEDEGVVKMMTVVRIIIMEEMPGVVLAEDGIPNHRNKVKVDGILKLLRQRVVGTQFLRLKMRLVTDGEKAKLNKKKKIVAGVSKQPKKKIRNHNSQ